jgi:tetratricopeptide (TPR) repeat protein
MRAGRAAFRLLVTAACLGLIVWVQAQTDRSSASFTAAQQRAALSLNEPLIPSQNAMRLLSLGQPQIAADVLWLQTIQYFGSGNPYGNYPSLGPILTSITSLDPKFEEPYEFGMVVLPFMGQADTAIALGTKADVELPGNGLLDFYHASNFLLYKKDYANAAKFYQKASKEPGAPGAAVTLAGTALDDLRNSTNDRLIAIQYWQTVEDNATSDAAREQADNYKKNMEIVYQLELAAQQYKSAHGSYPATLNDLVTAGIITQVPTSPIGRLYTLDPRDGSVSFDTLDPNAS